MLHKAVATIARGRLFVGRHPRWSMYSLTKRHLNTQDQQTNSSVTTTFKQSDSSHDVPEEEFVLSPFSNNQLVIEQPIKGLNIEKRIDKVEKKGSHDADDFPTYPEPLELKNQANMVKQLRPQIWNDQWQSQRFNFYNLSQISTMNHGIMLNQTASMSYDSSNKTHQTIHNLITGSKKRVFVFMKGVPSEPLCRYSGVVVQILDAYGVDYDSCDVLENTEIRQEIKSYSDWPTIPQVYMDGSFIGGCDILLQMHQSGELKQLFGDGGGGGGGGSSSSSEEK